MKNNTQLHGTKDLLELRVSSSFIIIFFKANPKSFTVAIKSNAKNGSLKGFMLFEYGKLLIITSNILMLAI